MNNKKNIKLSITEEFAKGLLQEYLSKGREIDGRLNESLNRLSNNMKDANDWGILGKTMTDLYKILQSSNERNKVVADTLLNHVMKQKQHDLETEKFEHRKNKDNLTDTDEVDDKFNTDDVKKEIRDIIKGIKT